VITGGQQHVLAVRAIDVLLEKQIGRQPLGLRRDDVTLLVYELKPRRRRRAIVVEHVEFHPDSRLHIERHRQFRAEAEILRPLPHVERHGGFAAARLARIDQCHRIFGFEPAEARRHPGGGEHLQVEKAIGASISVFVVAQVLLLHPFGGESRHAGIHRSRLRARDAQPLGASAFVDDLHEHRRIAGLLERGLRRSPRHLHARLRIDVHHKQHPGIEQFLQPGRIAGATGHREIAAQIDWQWRAEIVERFDRALNVRRERLTLDGHGRQRHLDVRRLLARLRRARQRSDPEGKNEDENGGGMQANCHGFHSKDAAQHISAACGTIGPP
jgi:hypothetical protein